MPEKSTKSIFARLWERRVPQFIATYVAICWGILQFVIFCTDRYGLDSSYIDRFLIFSLILVPAVAIFTYNHGKPGRDSWKRYEKIIIPLNFVLALVFAGLFGGGSEIKAAPQEVTVTTDTGDTITRLVPAMEQTKSFAIFPFADKNPSGQASWIKFGLPYLLKRDMEQDIRFFCISPFSFKYNLESNNHKLDENNIPFATFIKIAKDRIVDYFITGEYTSAGDKINCQVKVYETKTGEEFYSENYEGESIFDITDQVNKTLRNNLYLDKKNDNATTDLPASNLITPNTEALKGFVESKLELTFQGDYKLVLEKLRKATALDPQSAMIRSDFAQSLDINGKRDSASLAIEEALNLSNDLPERQKFLFRQRYYSYTNQAEKLIPLFESWMKLYPSDFYPYSALINFHQQTMSNNKAKDVSLAALENGHGARVLKDLAAICIQRNELDEAEQYIDEYYKLYPDKNKLEDTQLPEIYMKKGDFDKAEKWFESIALIKPSDHNISVELAKVYIKKGEFDKADRAFNTALRQCKLIQDSVNVFFNQMMLYTKTGEVSKFIPTVKAHFDGSSPNGNKINAMFMHLQLGGMYASLGQEEKLYEMADSIKLYVPQMHETYMCVVDFLVGLSTENMEKFKIGTTEPCRFIVTKSVPTFEFLIQALEAKFSGEYQESIRLLETYFDTSGADSHLFGSFVPENFRLNKEYQKSIDYCLETLETDPFEGTTLLELARAYHDSGQLKKAREVLTKIKTKMWHKAEPDYYYYDKMKAFEQKLDES